MSYIISWFIYSYMYLSAEAGIVSFDDSHAICDKYTNVPIIEFPAQSPMFICYIHNKFMNRPIKIES